MLGSGARSLSVIRVTEQASMVKMKWIREMAKLNSRNVMPKTWLLRSIITLIGLLLLVVLQRTAHKGWLFCSCATAAFAFAAWRRCLFTTTSIYAYFVTMTMPLMSYDTATLSSKQAAHTSLTLSLIEHVDHNAQQRSSPLTACYSHRPKRSFLLTSAALFLIHLYCYSRELS
ncbi:hypothetical protein Tcan_07556 [Toxocara canis]|uniref:Uncharacterized protein n=2 Tax=Toxocara canis TaxID=6265 RepID=A0A0B2VU33_TOXCA|nr:hypothetical protein Tcan_07556 [Toxocara canis]VDM37145.1 unnamed protein product [Toxocara canis]